MRGMVVYDPGAVTGGLPLDRDPHLTLAAAVLAWGPNPVGVRAADRAQIGLRLTGHARCAAADVRHRYQALPTDSELRPLTGSPTKLSWTAIASDEKESAVPRTTPARPVPPPFYCAA